MIIQNENYEINYDDIWSVGEKLPNMYKPIAVFYKVGGNMTVKTGWYGEDGYYIDGGGIVDALYWSVLPEVKIYDHTV